MSGGIRLSELPSGQCATVSVVDSVDGAVEQLMAMGVCAGRRVEVVKSGDPLILRVLGSRIGVSARLAQRVVVDPCVTEGCHATHQD